MKKAIAMNLQDQINLIELEASARQENRDEMFDSLLGCGIPPEIAARLLKLWGVVKKIGERFIHVGRIVLAELVRFLREHPCLCIGAALGAWAGLMVSCIPVIGVHLAPITALIGAVYGAAVGHGADTGRSAEHFIVLAWDAARIFFDLLLRIFKQICLS